MGKLLIALFFLFPEYAFSQTAALKWFKGNTHTHSLWSDGNDFPEMIMDWYKTHGYDFLALSDHNILAEGEKWVKVPAHPFRQRRFKEYVEKFGADWVVQKTDSAGLINVRLKTLAEYKPLFEEKNKFLLIQAEEITDKFEKKQVHIGAINVQEVIKPQGGTSVVDVMQRNLDQVYAQRLRTGKPMFAHINHPNYVWSIKLEDMMQLKGERFFEVYNGHPHVHNYGDSTTMGMEELWDKLLIHYIREGKDLVYGLATDDAHDYLEYKIGTANPGRGWIMVRAATLETTALIAAMEKGDFYATTGVELSEMDFNNDRLNISIKPQDGVQYRIQFWGASKKKINKQGGKLLKEVKGTEANFKLRKKYLYVRGKIISDKLKENPFAAGDVETAWTQPVVR
jgi:hypothetical protein